MHTKRICKVFEIKNLGKYHNFYLKSDALLLADVFKNSRKKDLQIYQLNRLAWQAAFKKTKVKLELLTDIDMLLIVEKGITVRICYSINRYAKVNDKYITDYDKNEELSYLKYWDLNNLYVWAMS